LHRSRFREAGRPLGLFVVSLPELLRTLSPVRQPGVYVYCALPSGMDVSALPAAAWMREAEGVTVILEEASARAHGLEPRFRAAWITLTVHSALDGVGLTAAVAGALAAEGISCNVVAALHHDHLFVPIESGDAALAALERLSKNSPPP
jgi:uncharacterized protein